MTIASALENAHRKIENAYSVIEEKGGTLPEIQNLSNLSEAIESISGGSGSVPIEVINKTGATVNKNDKVWINMETEDFTKVGSVSVVDRVASGFSTSSYIDTGKIFDFHNSNWEIGYKIQTPSSLSTEQNMIGCSPSTYIDFTIPIIIIKNGVFGFLVSSTGSSWNILNITGSNVQTNKEYYIRYGYNGSQYYFEYSFDGIYYTRDITITSSELSTTNTKAMMSIGRNQWGSGSSDGRTFDGSMYLEDFYVRIGADTWTPYFVSDLKQIVNYNQINKDSFTAIASEQIADNETGLVYSSIVNSTIDVINKSGEDLAKNQKVWINTTENAAHFSKVGGVVVSNDFVASNFNASNFIMLDQVFTPNDNPWEVNLKLTWDGSSGEDYAFGSTSSGYLKVGLDNGRPCLYASRISTDWNIGSITANEALTPNVWYYLRASFTGSAYKLYLSTNGVTYNQIAGGAETTPVVTFTDTTIGGGNTRWGSNYRGQIDLKECYIKINDEITWRGVTASQALNPKQIVSFENINKDSSTAITAEAIANNTLGLVYPAALNKEITITENGTYEVENGYTGFGPVTVNVEGGTAGKTIEVINKSGSTVDKNTKVWINSDEPGSISGTVVGNPTISAASVVSNFSASNYLTTQLPSISQSFTLISRIYIPDTVSQIGNYAATFSTDNGNTSYGIGTSSGRVYTGIYWNTGAGTGIDLTSGWKWLRMEFTSSSTALYIIDDNNYTEETLPSLSDWAKCHVSSYNFLESLSGRTLFIGVNHYQGNSTANWQIDLKNTKYIADEVTTWKGATEPSVLDPKQIVSFDRINKNSFTATTAEQIDNENTGLVYLSIPDDRKTIEVINKSGDDVGKLKKVWINTTEPGDVNYTIVGTPTITDDFVASGFSDTNYLTIPYTLPSDTQEIEIGLHFRGQAQESPNPGQIIGFPKVGSSDYGAFEITRSYSTNRQIAFRYCASADSFMVPQILSSTADNTEYWAKAIFSISNKQFIFSSSTNGIDYTETFNHIYTDGRTFNLDTQTQLTIGKKFRGDIFLKDCYVKVNGEDWWRYLTKDKELDPKQIVTFDRINENSFTAITKTGIRNNEMGEVYITSVEGGGEGETIDVIAIDEAKSFDVDNKVILNVNDVMSDDLMKGVNTKTITIANTLDLGIKSPGGAITKDSILVPVNNFDRSTDLGAVVIGSRTSDTSWSLNDTLSQNISSVRMLDAFTNLCIAIQRYSTSKGYKIGYLENGLFTPVSGAITFTESELSIVKCKDLVYEAHHGVVIDTSTEEMIQVPYRPGSIIIYYDNNYYAYSNGEEYILENDRLSWKATGFTSNINNSGIIGARMGNNSPISFQYLGDCSGKFFASSMIVFERVDGIPGQSNTTYKRNDKLTEALHIGPNIICFDVQKDNESDDYYIFIMDYSGKNILARFNDGNITILPSIFTDTNITGVIAAAMNWKDGLFMCGVLEEESITQFHAKTYVKTINVASPYQYFTAGNSVRSLVSTDILSGFVKETNTDEYGNKVLTISTVTDPSEAPWSPNDIVYGFDVSIEQGEEILAVELNPETETNNVKGFVIDYDLTNLLGLPNNYTPVYKSTNNAIQSSYSYAKIEIDANKVSSVTLWINSFAETTYDYTTASALDGTKDATDLTTSGFQFNPRLGLDTLYWKTATYTIPQDGGNHWIWVRYRKDSSADKDDDTGRFTLSYTVR